MKYEGYRYWRSNGGAISYRSPGETASGMAEPRADMHTAVVVLDPDDREQMEALARARFGTYGPGYFDHLPPGARVSLVDAMAAAVRSLLPPPPKVKPEEPTEWGSLVREGGVLWQREYGGRDYYHWSDAVGAIRCWPDFSDDVQIIRIGTGVES